MGSDFVTVIGTVAAIVYPMDNITNFLYLIGSVFAPMIAVQIADYFILKKADAEESAFQWRNLVVWLVGFSFTAAAIFSTITQTITVITISGSDCCYRDWNCGSNCLSDG